MPQPTSKPGQPGGHHGPTRPTYVPLDLSSTTNMPTPCNTQCPDMIAALRQPIHASVTGFPSAVMKRPEAESASIPVVGSILVLRPPPNVNPSVSITRPVGLASGTPGLSGGSHGFP